MQIPWIPPIRVLFHMGNVAIAHVHYEVRHTGDIGVVCDYGRGRAEFQGPVDAVVAGLGVGDVPGELRVREGLGRKQLQELGARMIEMRDQAPRTPTQPSALKKAVDAVVA